jgi:hypothetical protein
MQAGTRGMQVRDNYRKSFYLIGALAWVITLSPALAADSVPPPEPVSEFQRALFDDATFTLHLRSYLLDRYDDPDPSSNPDPAAMALGGWLGYETAWIGDFLKLGVVGYTSQPLWAPEDRDGSLLLLPDQEGYSVLGQAYAALKFEEQVLTFYRQLVNQPEVNLQDNRMTPNTFEGGSLKGDLGPVSYYAGMLTAMKKRNSDEFINIANAANSAINDNSYMYLGGLEFSPIDDLKARTSLYVVPELLASSYSDAVWTFGLMDDTKLRLSSQFMVQSGIGDQRLEEALGSEVDAWVAGFKGDFIYRGLTFTAGYTVNGEENGWQAPYGSWPGYTSMIVEDFNRAEEQAFLVGLSFDFAEVGAEGLVFTALAAFDLHVADDLQEQNEYDFTADYRFTSLGENPDWSWLSPLWLRARYALVEKDELDEKTDQRDDFRIILNYELQFTGSDI